MLARKSLACASSSIQSARWVMYKANVVLASRLLSVIIMFLCDN